MPAQEAEVRRMSMRRMRVPLSGECLRSSSTRERGKGSALRSSRDGRAMGDWHKEQREWEERAEAVTGIVGEAEPKVIECGMVPSSCEARNAINHNVNVNFHGNRGMGAITGDRNVSWETGDDVGGLHNDTTDSPGNCRKFFAWVLTWKGILITIYSLNIVAWGGMLFLLLVNAAPAMCHPTCHDINSSRRIWVEIDSQILNALFCVTGFGLIPWRFRDLYLLMRYRIRGDTAAWDRLRGVHHTWNTWLGKPWKVDLVVHLYCFNTYFQAVLAGLMWGMTRYNRPAAGTGAAVAAACLAAMAGGWIEWQEARKVKKARPAGRGDGRESGHAGGLRLSQLSRGTEGDRDEERAVKSKEAGLT